MAMKKADMEIHQAEYDALMGRARVELQAGNYKAAIDLAVSSWQYLVGMMEYERKYENREFESLQAIDLVLKYAPLMFERRVLADLSQLLKTERRIDKNTSTDLSEKVKLAWATMWDTHRLWDLLERQGSIRQDEAKSILGGDQKRWRRIAETLETMGLLVRAPESGSYVLRLSTRMDELTVAKCPHCGVTGQAPKRTLMSEINCPKCKARDFFVILPGWSERKAAE